MSPWKGREAAEGAGWQPRSGPCVSSLISAPCMRTGTHQVICAPDGVQGSSPQNTPRQHIDCSEVKRLEKQLVQKAYSALLLLTLKPEYKSPCGNTFPVPEVERHLYNQRGKCKAEMAVQGTSKPCYFTNLLPQVKTPCFVKSSHTQSCLPCHFLSLVSSIFARNSVRLDFCYCFVLGKFNC